MSSDQSQIVDEVVRFEAVGKTFGTREVLKDQTFSVKPGELFVIIGPSGTGKSVTLKLIAGLLHPTQGSVKVLGQEVSQCSSEALANLRRRIGFLFQGGALLGWKTLAENIALPLVEHGGLSASEIQSRVAAALAEVGLQDAGELYPAEVSGGMLKRAAFARAIIENPEVLLFDEPTSGLDPVMAYTIDALIHKINRTHNAACIVVTHDLVGALRYADRIGFLKEGKFLMVGTPEAIRASEIPEIKAFLNPEQTEVIYG
jgi:phospholipid/cholesterol/gamma-HCH transport system ATP-binding protein